MNKKLLLLLGFVFIAGFSQAQMKDEQLVRDLINSGLVAWNKGDLDEFMEGYWNSDSLMFVGKKGVTYGWKNTLDNYKKAYPDTVAMGKLDFTIIEVKRLSVLYFHVTGKWHLTRTAGDLEGHFTLLVKKVKGKWVIVSDHSS